MRKIMLALVLLGVLAGTAQAGRLRPEREYQADWCAGRGEAEVRLGDGTRVDCLTATHAVELDFAAKWAEAVGQALFYGQATCRRAGIVLILEKPGDRAHLDRLRDLVRAYRLPVDVWAIGPGAEQEKSQGQIGQ